MRTLLSDSALDENSINEIADSPKLWWQIQSDINRQKTLVKAPWPPSILRRIFLWTTPVAVAAAVIIAIFVFRSGQSGDNNGLTAEKLVPVNTDTKTAMPDAGDKGSNSEINAVEPSSERVAVKTKSTSPPKSFRAVQKQPVLPTTSTIATSIPKKTNEVKTEFIALSYARDPESGQIVRVKVPSSMMVSLGLVANVKKPSELVDAEVIIGDDGLTRAIRFIH